MTLAVAAKITIGFGLALAAAVLVPRTADDSGDVPGLGLLLTTGVLVGLATTGALYLVLRRDLGLPATIALFAVGYNALVVLVKFVLSPEALYEHSEAGTFEAWFNPSETGEAIIISTCVFALYALALLRFGSDATCAVSLAALVAGSVVLLVALRPPLLVALAPGSLVLGIALLLRQLQAAADARAEQIAIGLGARLGNGLLLVVLAWLVLGGEEASAGTRAVFAWLLAALFGASVAALAARPERVVIGYKG